MTIKIELGEDKTLTSLAGNEYGSKIYLDQVKNKLDLEEVNHIEFPRQIDKVAISFVQGFTRDLLEELGFEKFNEKIKIDGSEKLKRKFENCIG